MVFNCQTTGSPIGTSCQPLLTSFSFFSKLEKFARIKPTCCVESNLGRGGELPEHTDAQSSNTDFRDFLLESHPLQDEEH